MAAKEKIAWVTAEATPSLIPIAYCPLSFYYHTCRNLATHDSRTKPLIAPMVSSRPPGSLPWIPPHGGLLFDHLKAGSSCLLELRDGKFFGSSSSVSTSPFNLDIMPLITQPSAKYPLPLTSEGGPRPKEKK
jgi:hypothetical protein